jgi:hypothetical protein
MPETCFSTGWRHSYCFRYRQTSYTHRNVRPKHIGYRVRKFCIELSRGGCNPERGHDPRIEWKSYQNAYYTIKL